MQTREEKEAPGSRCPHHDEAWAMPEPFYLCGCAMDKWTRKRLLGLESNMPCDRAVLGEDDGYHD